MIKRLIFAIVLLSIIGASAVYCSAKEEPTMQVVEKEGIIFEMTLLNSKELAENCSLVTLEKKDDYDYPELNADEEEDLRYQPIYLFGSVQGTMNRGSYITFKVASPNNESFTAPEINIGAIPGNRGPKIYFLRDISIDVRDPYLKKKVIPKSETKLDVEILKAFYK